MPYAPAKHCPKPGHPTYQGKQCPLCADSRRKAADARRGTASQRGYGADWKALRAQLMPPGTRCACGCGKLASHLDHIVPRARGGTDDPSNLQPLARGCHSRKTAAEDGGFGNQRKGVGGSEFAKEGPAPGGFSCAHSQGKWDFLL